jgi:hypothetical protein
MPSAAIPAFTAAVTRPGEAGYDAARAIWNARHDRRAGVVWRTGAGGLTLRGGVGCLIVFRLSQNVQPAPAAP